MIGEARIHVNARNLDELQLAQLEVEALYNPQVIGYLVGSKEFYVRPGPDSHLHALLDRVAFVDSVDDHPTLWMMLRKEAFDENKQDHSTHNLAPFEGKMMPQLARALINICTGGLDGAVVCDPFCGSGTVPLEAHLLGHHVRAGDVDPYAVHLTTEKLKRAKPGGPGWQVSIQDCRTTLDIPVGAVVTSPPYFNAIDYIERHTVKRDSIGLAVPQHAQLGIGQSVNAYEESVHAIGAAIAKTLLPKGRCAIVIGDNQGVPSSLWYEMALKSNGLRMVARINRPYAIATRGFDKDVILIAEKV